MERQSDKLTAVARELIWWQAPDKSLAEPRRLLAQVMALGTWQEVQEAKAAFGWSAFKDALLNLPAGIMDKRSWVYWRNYFGLPEAEMPRRSLK